MDANPPRELAHKDVSTDLQATLAARRELDPEMEEHLIASFLARIEQQVDARVDEKLQQARVEAKMTRSTDAPRRSSDNDNFVAVVASSFALAIPLMVIAGIFMHGTGVIAVMAGLVLVNALYFVAQVEGRRH